jgi:signal transduction histidine kinase/uncharacterized damage-inducible protein DinB
MRSKPRFRLAELLVAVAIVATVLVWAERTAWRQITILRAEMNVHQIERFRTADQLRAGVLQMQHLWRREIDQTNADNLTEIATAGQNIKELITTLANRARSQDEAELVKKTGVVFDEYLSHISDSIKKAQLTVERDPSRALNQGVEIDLERLLVLTEKLTATNRSDAERFMTDANVALTRLQRFLFTSLVGLLICGAAVIVLIYRRTIAPLQNTLTESRAIIERQEKLASLGVFATGIAHEIRNPLTAIKVRLFTLRGSHQPGTSEHEDLEVIRGEIDRLERIVSEFLQFARPAEPELKTIPADKLLREIHNLLQSDLASRSVKLELELRADATIRVDSDKMKQVLINFIQNGADSMEKGGTVTLRLHRDRQLLNGRWVTAVIIDIADQGKGIPPEVQKRLFDPFFTTKEAGTGLGLPIAARIVEKHGGAIQYQTQMNRGTTFSIVLPPAPTNET